MSTRRFNKPVRLNFGFGGLEVQVGDLVKQSEILRKRAQRLADLGPLFRVAVSRFGRVQGDWFDTEGRGSWKPLSEMTVEKRTRKERRHGDGSTSFGGDGYYARSGDQGPEHLILQWTGKMRQDFVTHRSNVHAVREIDGDRLTYGSSRDRAVWNHPTRPVLDSQGLQLTMRLTLSRFVVAALTDKPFHVWSDG